MCGYFEDTTFPFPIQTLPLHVDSTDTLTSHFLGFTCCAFRDTLLQLYGYLSSTNLVASDIKMEQSLYYLKG